MEKETIYEILGFTLAFLGLGIAYYSIYFGMKNDRIKRELTHKERMRSIELGRRLPGDGPWLNPLRIGFATAVLVPIAVFLTSAIASSLAGLSEVIWRVATMISLTSIISGAIICCFAIVRPERSEGQGPLLTEYPKPHVEEDAYDVVSSRG